MKKLFIFLAIGALGFIGCNNDAENKESLDSIAVAPLDTTVGNATPMDTMVNLDTAATVSTDTTAHH